MEPTRTDSQSPATRRRYHDRAVRPRAAWAALSNLIKDPDDTSQVFEIIDALAGRSFEKSFKRFRRSPNGPRWIEEQPDIVAVLNDRDALGEMPVGSLGRAYLDFVIREDLTPEGLSSASKEFDQDPEAPKGAYWFGARLRDTHDLHHVLTGYNRDLVGEASLLAFTWAQTRNRGIGAIVLMAYIRSGQNNPAARGMIRAGYRRGRKAAWFPEQDWEQLLMQPLEDVREHLRLGDLPAYDEVRSEGAPALA
jgi:ubiquinone biosynthesis protein COQ4